MDKYFYFIAELPYLYFGKEAPITKQWFLEEAEKWLDRKDYNTLTKIDYLDCQIKPEDPPVLKQYKQFEANFREEIANWRKARDEQQEYKPSTFPISLLKEGTPLNIERNLLMWRWKYIETLEPEHHFDFGFIVLYYIKMQLLEKYFTFNKEKGKERYQHYIKIGL